MPVPSRISPACFTGTHGYGNRNRLWVRERVESEWICEVSRKEWSKPLILSMKGSKARPVKELQQMEHPKGNSVKLPRYADSWNYKYFCYPQQLHLHVTEARMVVYVNLLGTFCSHYFPLPLFSLPKTCLYCEQTK